MKRRTSMARKTAGAKRAKKSRATRPKAAPNLKQTLYSFGLWALAIFNTVLIVSFLMKYIPTDGESPISAVSDAATGQVQSPIRLEVLNGCGASGVGKKFADFLKRAGYEPINVDNYDNFDMPNTFIIDRRSLTNELAGRVAKSLGLTNPTNVFYQASDVSEADVTIVIGKDYAQFEFLQNTPR